MNAPESNQPATESNMESDILALAREADSGAELSQDRFDSVFKQPDHAAANVKSEAKPEVETVQEEASQDGLKKPVEAKLPETTDKNKTDSETLKPDEKQLSKFERAKKENQRLEKTWKSVNEEKERVRAEKEAYLAEKARLEAEVKAHKEELLKAKANPPKADRTAEDYEAAAKQFEEEGRPDLAAKAKARANEVREEAKSREEAKGTLEKQEAQRKFQAEWDSRFEKEAEKMPELRDTKSPIGQEIIALMEKNPILQQYPGGITDAIEIAKMRMDVKRLSASESALSKQLKEISTKYEDLTKKMTPSVGAPNGSLSAKSTGEMSAAEHESDLLSKAMELDQMGSR
jgi:colicin import membrane protein